MGVCVCVCARWGKKCHQAMNEQGVSRCGMCKVQMQTIYGILGVFEWVKTAAVWVSRRPPTCGLNRRCCHKFLHFATISILFVIYKIECVQQVSQIFLFLEKCQTNLFKHKTDFAIQISDPWTKTCQATKHRLHLCALRVLLWPEAGTLLLATDGEENEKQSWDSRWKRLNINIDQL